VTGVPAGVLTEDEALDLLAYLVTSARTQVDEAAEYGPLRLLTAARRLGEAIAARSSDATAEFVAGPLTALPELAVPQAGRAEYVARLDGVSFPSLTRLGARWLRGRDAYVPQRKRGQRVTPEAAFCAEIVASCYIEMGILRDDRRATWYDPGKFWSGDYLPISPGWSLGKEVAVSR